VANPETPKNSILSMMALAGTITRFWSMVIFLLVEDVVLTRDTVPTAFRGVKHWIVQRLLDDCDVTKSPVVDFPPQHLPHATREWFLLVITLEFIPKEDWYMVFHYKWLYLR
jgi:hypothetical protein